MVQEVSHLELVTHDNDGEQISKGWCEVLNSFCGFTDKLFEVLIDLFLNRGAQVDKDSEKSKEVHKSADCDDRTMLVLTYEINHVSDDQLWHNLKDHAFIEVFAGAALAHVAHGMLQQVHESLVRVDVLDHSLV